MALPATGVGNLADSDQRMRCYGVPIRQTGADAMMAYDATRTALFSPGEALSLFGTAIHTPTRPSTTDAVVLECARLAYVPFEQGEQTRLLADLDRAGFSNVQTFSVSSGTQCFAARHAGDDSAVIAFRGTEINRVRDLITDLRALPTTWRGPGQVHGGFCDAFMQVERDLDDWLARYAPSSRLIVTGHSLGAALATLAAARWVTRRPRLVTMGSPRVGDSRFCDSLEGLVMRRYVHCADGVVDLPPALPPGNYRHAGAAIYIDRNGRLQPGFSANQRQDDIRRARFEHWLAPDLRWLRERHWLDRSLTDHAPINYLRAVLAG